MRAVHGQGARAARGEPRRDERGRDGGVLPVRGRAAVRRAVDAARARGVREREREREPRRDERGRDSGVLPVGLG